MQFFQIEEKVVKPNFRLIISWMHGDADGYTDTEFVFETEVELWEHWNLFSQLIDVVPQHEFLNWEKWGPKAAVSLGLSEDDLENSVGDMFECDITYSDCYARYNGSQMFAVIDGQEYKIAPCA